VTRSRSLHVRMYALMLVLRPLLCTPQRSSKNERQKSAARRVLRASL
jgi:hypothetical protein